MGVVRKILNGTFLQKITLSNLLFMGFCVLLLMVYISLRYTCNATIRKINTIYKEITILKAKSLETKTIYQNTISMHNLDNKLKERGIGISKEPVKDIIIIE